MVSAIAWLAVVVVIALGGAGIVAATDPGTGRAEQARLVYGGDTALTEGLDMAEAELGLLSADVDDLGVQARGALAATVSGDADTVDNAIAAGDKRLVAIGARSGAIGSTLAGLPYVSTPEAALHVSPALRRRYDRLVAALAATDGLQSAWDRLTVSSSSAGRLAAQLAAHDKLVAEAASQGRDAKYAKAITTLKGASKVITESQAFRDQLANTVDVTVLDQWLERNAVYDKALSALYDALDSVGGKVTSKVRKAITAEKAARAQLPPDSRGLVIIMGDIAQGGLSGAVVAIEQARAQLSAALEPPDPEASPSPQP